MLKMFHKLDVDGGNVAFWEQAWREGDYTESARFCDADPLWHLFDRHVRPGSVMLEGGCGRGAYVAHHSARGVRAVGLDFAVKTLADVRHRYPSLLLGAADVARLPLRDSCVETYYSGGVVEHFESGPYDAIAEAKRVLDRNGVLLISVPYFSPLRRLLAPFRRRDWRRARVHAVDSAPPQRVFFQYAYTPKEFGQILADSGFCVSSRRGYSILWGLYEIPLMGRVLKRAAQRDRHVAVAEQDAPVQRSPLDPSSGRSSVLKRLVVSEDDSIRLAGGIVRLFRWAAANMMMYVCVPTEAGRP